MRQCVDMRTRSLFFVFLLCSCGSDSGEGVDAGARIDSAPPSDSPSGDGAQQSDATPNDATQPDAGGIGVIAPPPGAELIDSAAIKVSAPSQTANVVVTEPVSGATCTAPAPYFECLLDLTASAPGDLDLTLVAVDAGDQELASAGLAVARRSIDAPCTGTVAERNACIVGRADAGDSAGFEGVSYLDADDGHANVDTSGMTGIDARVLAQPQSTIPDGVEMGVMNESTAWVLTDGRCSLIRCYPYNRRAYAITHYQGNVIFMFPEHRDVGIRDFYQWQAPFYVMSQGSSGSEKDEVVKALQVLGVMTGEARTAAKDAAVVGPLLSFLLWRTRVDSVTAYMNPDAHPSAMTNADNGDAILSYAAAVRADELPPVGELEVTDSTLPSEWGMVTSLDTDYAVGITPAETPADAPAGAFSVSVDLGASFDANDRALMFFPVVLRGTADVQRTGDGQYTISGDFPVDEEIETGGQTRTVSRVTVAFFPHNGIWLGTPAMISVGGRASEDAAPDSNNLD